MRFIAINHEKYFLNGWWNTRQNAWFFKEEHHDTLLSMMNPSLGDAVEPVTIEDLKEYIESQNQNYKADLTLNAFITHLRGDKKCYLMAITKDQKII